MSFLSKPRLEGLGVFCTRIQEKKDVFFILFVLTIKDIIELINLYVN